MCYTEIHTDKRYTYIKDKMGSKNNFKVQTHAPQLRKKKKTKNPKNKNKLLNSLRMSEAISGFHVGP